jgi:hypothetical protein
MCNELSGQQLLHMGPVFESGWTLEIGRGYLP